MRNKQLNESYLKIEGYEDQTHSCMNESYYLNPLQHYTKHCHSENEDKSIHNFINKTVAVAWWLGTPPRIREATGSSPGLGNHSRPKMRINRL